jgi:hypothetical protein
LNIEENDIVLVKDLVNQTTFKDSVCKVTKKKFYLNRLDYEFCVFSGKSDETNDYVVVALK